MQSISILSFYLSIDAPIVTTLLGLFGSKRFSISKCFENSTLNKYSLHSSATDFLFLSLFRLVFLVLPTLLKQLGKSFLISYLEKPIATLCVSSISFSFVKLLLFSEHPELIQSPGGYLLPFWTILSSLICYGLWRYEFRTFLVSEEKEDEEEIEEKRELDKEIPLTKTEQCTILLKYSLDHWKWLLIGVIFTSISSAVDVVSPHYSSEVLNKLSSLKESPDFYRTIQQFFALTVVGMVISGVRSGIVQYLTATMVAQMRTELFQKILNQEIAFFDKYKSGAIQSRLNSDSLDISSKVLDFFCFLVRLAFIFTGKLLFMLSLSWQLTCINFVAFPIIVLATNYFSAFSVRMSEKSCKVYYKSFEISDEAISSMRTVRSFAAERISLQKFKDTIEEHQAICRKECFLATGRYFTNDLYYNAIYVGILMYGARLVMTGTMEGAALLTFMMYQMEIGGHIQELNYEIPALMRVLSETRKLCQYLTRIPKILNDGQFVGEIKGELKFENVSFTYPSRSANKVIDNLSLHVRPGETLALVGPSGGGKSTIVALIERFYEPEEGEIYLDGTLLRDYEHEEYHRKISLVSQEPVLFDYTIRDNISFGCEASDTEVEEAAKTANAHNFIMEMEKGYKTKCGEKGVQLSGGQKQRIAIARALVRNPSILILDEATSALDNQSERIVQEAMENCSSNRTVIVIAHRLSTIQKADRIAVIDKGQVAQIGSHAELMLEEQGLYYGLVSAAKILE